MGKKEARGPCSLCMLTCVTTVVGEVFAPVFRHWPWSEGLSGENRPTSVLPTDLPPPSLGLLTLSAEGQGDPASFCHLMYVARDSRTLHFRLFSREKGIWTHSIEGKGGFPCGWGPLAD